MHGSKTKLPQVGSNPTVNSDRVQAPMVDAGPVDSGEGHNLQMLEATQPFSGQTSSVEMTERGDETQEGVQKGYFRRKDNLARTPPDSPIPAEETESSHDKMVKEILATRLIGGLKKVGSMPDLTEASKRKREEEDNVSTDFKLISELILGIQELNNAIGTSQNTRRDIVQKATRLGIIAKKISQEKIEAMRQEAGRKEKVETADRNTKTAKIMKNKSVTTREISTQTEEQSPPQTWVRRSYKNTEIKEGSPLELEAGWDLAVFRRSNDVGMEAGIQRMFRNKYPELKTNQSSVVHVKTTTWIMGDEKETQNTKNVFAITDGNKEEIRARVQEVLSKVMADKGNKLAIAWEEDARLSVFRDIIEEEATKWDTKVNIHIKPRQMETKKAKEESKQKQDTEAIIVKKAAGISYSGILKDVKEHVQNHGLGTSIRGVRETRSGDLILTMSKNSENKDDSRKMKEALQGKWGKENIRLQKSIPEATIFVKDIDAITTSGEIQQAMAAVLNKEANEIEVVTVRQAFAGTQNAIINVTREEAEKLLQLQRIRIGLPMCRVLTDRRVTTCYKCWMPGHVAKDCQGPDRTDICRNCGEAGHQQRECRNDSKCAICGKAGHLAKTNGCKVFRQALQRCHQEMKEDWQTPKARKGRKASSNTPKPTKPPWKPQMTAETEANMPMLNNV